MNQILSEFQRVAVQLRLYSIFNLVINYTWTCIRELWGRSRYTQLVLPPEQRKKGGKAKLYKKKKEKERRKPSEKRGVGRSVEFNGAWKRKSGVKIGEVACSPLQSSESGRKKERQRAESKMSINHERELGGKKETEEDWNENEDNLANDQEVSSEAQRHGDEEDKKEEVAGKREQSPWC